MVDIPGNSSTTRSIAVGGTLSDTLESVGDRDWVRIDLTAGQSINVLLDGLGLGDAHLRIRNASGAVLYENDDIVTGIVRDAEIGFTASYTGTHFIDAGAFEDNYSGTYALSVSNYVPPPLATVDQIADQLVSGYWGGQQHRFNVSPGGSLTVNLTALTAGGQQLARAALSAWTDIIGVRFAEVAIGGQIKFDDNEDGAHASSVHSGGFITSSDVNVSAQWLTDYGTTLNSYSFQTYIHEVGHALGLGHAGDYNLEARYPFDAKFENDSVALSVMSYFNQQENTYVAGQGFSELHVGTPMAADIVAMSRLYGLSTTTRAGDTVYGFGSTANNAVFDAAAKLDLAYTIYDSGGIDTLNFSGFAAGQRIDLNSESFSNVGARTGNVGIARGVVIENAIGGSGDDTLIGNGANNVLDGGFGEDTISYAGVGAGVTVSLDISGAQVTGGAGTDTLISFENLYGSDHGDRLTGGGGYTDVRGGGGNDTLVASADGDFLYGDAGDDTFIGGAANDPMEGGEGFDTVDYSSASGPVKVGTFGRGANGTDTFTSIERILGSNFGDEIWYFNGVMMGGAGSDVYEVSSGQVVEFADQGSDTIRSYGDYTLPEHVENLWILKSTDPYAGVVVGRVAPAPVSGTGNSLDNFMMGSEGDNQLSGLAGADRMIGGDGSDTLIGGADNDSLDGGNGIDTASYAHAAGAVLVDLAAGTATGADGSDQIVRIENIVGSAHGDSLVGNASDNSLIGGAGSDTLDGRAGSDTAAYSGLFRSYSAGLGGASGTIAGGAEGGTDTLASIETVEFRDGTFVFDANGVAAQVMRLYDTVLQRAADNAGLDYYCDFLEDLGGTLKQVATGFLNSPEFQAATGSLTTAAYVEFLYQHALGRASDAAGMDYYVTRLESGELDRADLLVGFSESPEHRGQTAALVDQGFFNTDDDYQAVALLYDTFAGRRPDAAGLIYYADLIKSGTLTLDQIADNFANSPEFRGLTDGMTNNQLINFMYENTLERPAEAAGLAYWNDRLNAGIDRGDLLLGFSQSNEHFVLLGDHVTNGIDYL